MNPTPIRRAGNSAFRDLECSTARASAAAFAGRERRAIPSASPRSNWRKSAPWARPRDDLWRGAQPKYRPKSLARSALRPAAIGVQPRRRHRGGDIHVIIEHIDDDLQHGRDDAAAARRSRHQNRLAVLQHDGRRHRLITAVCRGPADWPRTRQGHRRWTRRGGR